MAERDADDDDDNYEVFNKYFIYLFVTMLKKKQVNADTQRI